MALTKQDRDLALKIIPEGCKLNWHNTTKRWYAYTATYHYSPEKKRGIEKRTHVGHIDENGLFVYSEHYLMKQELKQRNKEDAPAKLTKAVEKIQNAVLHTVEDPRRVELCRYQLDEVAFVATLAAMSGQTSAVQIADCWKNNRKFFEEILPDFPKTDISHDTVRRLLCLLEPKQIHNLFTEVLKSILPRLKQPIVAVDGQAVRATKSSADGKVGRYLISFYNTDVGMTLGQELVGDKKNETSHARSMVKGFDLAGSVVTADALHAQKAFADALYKARADYCISLKGNQGGLFEEVQDLFKYSGTAIQYGNERVEKGHGRLETRRVDLLSADYLPLSTLKVWPGLTEGTLVRCVSSRTSVSTGEVQDDIRYFISSLNFSNPNIHGLIERAIRRHWAIENELPYVLDVDFNQDRTQCKNMNYLQNRTLLNKLALNFIQAARGKMDVNADHQLPSVKRMMAKYTSPKAALDAIAICLLEPENGA